MKQRFTIAGKDGRYFLWDDGHEYTTPCLFSISSCDKGLIEAIGRKISENKPNLVKLYLRKYDNAELVNIIKDLISEDNYWGPCEITNNAALCAKVFTNIQLRKLIDAYSECGSINLALSVAMDIVRDDFYDPFMAGMAETSGISLCPGENTPQTHFENLREYFDDWYERDVREELSIDFLERFIIRYKGCLLPKNESARFDFPDLLEKLETEPEDLDE